MPRKQGDPCPHCEGGKLSVHPDRMIADHASHRTWLCDTCGKTCKDNFIEILENVDIADNVTAKLNDVKPNSIESNPDDICQKCKKPRLAHKGRLGVINPMGGPPLCIAFIEKEK